MSRSLRSFASSSLPAPHLSGWAGTGIARAATVARLTALGALALLAGCGSSPQSNLPSLVVQPQAFEIGVAASGELRAAQSTPINVPNVVMGPQVLTWIAPEGEALEAGDAIARFDGSQFELERDRADIELSKVGLSREAKARELSLELSGVSGSRALVVEELALSQRFASADLRLYSRNEILDMLQDQAYLGSQSRYFDWKATQSEQRSEAEIALLETQAARHRLRMEQNAANLGRLEVVAPHAGVLVHARNWWGEAPSAGQTVWPGMKLGELPAAGGFEARLHVLESEAGGLAVDQAVAVRLDAAPTRTFAGRVKSIGQVAAPRERDSPVKYFEFIVSLDESDPSLMRSGSTVTARVEVARLEAALAVPNQALYSDAQGSWVYVLDRGGRAERRAVQTGRRSGTRTEIVEGLAAGERIALARPPGAEA